LRNKIFAVVFSVIFLFMFVGAPTVLVLTKLGVLEYNNLGNEITVDKVYDNSTAFGRAFNKIEQGKLNIKETYIDSLPFYEIIKDTYAPFKSSANQPFMNWLQEKGNEYTEFECPHVEITETTPATCTEDGVEVITCKLCGETLKTKALTALGHAFEESSKVEPSCESDGYTLFVCTRCNASEQRDVVEAPGHDYVLQTEKAATCTEGGFSSYTCSVCGEGLEVDTPTLSHTFEDGVCTACGALETEVPETPVEPEAPAEPDTPAEPETPTEPDTPSEPDTPTEPDKPTESEHQHSYEKKTVAPLCTTEGYDIYTCSCGDTYQDNKTPPTGHKYTSTVVLATCTEDGYTDKVCQLCGDSQKTDTVSALGHNYEVTTVAPTYTSVGYDLHKCTKCSDSFKDNEVPMLENIIPEPTTTPDPSGTKYTASLKTTDNIFRHYAITADFPDGSQKTTYARIVLLDREELRENMLSVVSMVNAMVEKDRNVNWYFSFATNIEATDIGTKMMPQESTRHIYEEFLTKVDSSVKVNAVEVNSFNDYYNKFFITDHHWNHHGSEEAYLGIVKMLRENYPDIVPLEVEDVYEFKDVQFFGSLSRAHSNKAVWDTFGVYYRSLPSHTLVRDEAIAYGSKKTQSANLRIYRSGEHNKASGYNHYTEFYRVAKEIKYKDNNTGRNLLLIGDSYSLPLLEVVAAHFDNTYVRYEDRSWNNFPEELIYEDFIKENNITDVIVIEEMAKSIMQGYGTAYPSGFLNIFPDENW